ncbi:hypothetical protein D3C78_1699140 [compost metagenome]
MQTFVVNPLIVHAIEHLHATYRQAGAMDPTGGFTQAFTDLAGFTLQQEYLAWRGWHFRPLGTQAPALLEL